MAGSVPNRPLELFMLYEVPPLDDRLPDPRLIYLQTMLGAVEMLQRRRHRRARRRIPQSVADAGLRSMR